MDPLLQVHSPTPIRQPVAESRVSNIAGEGLRRGPSLPRIWELADPPGVTSGAVARAIGISREADTGRSIPARRDHGARPFPGTARAPRHGTDADPM